MQSMFDTVETENQLSFAEKLHFRVITSQGCTKMQDRGDATLIHPPASFDSFLCTSEEKYSAFFVIILPRKQRMCCPQVV